MKNFQLAITLVLLFAAQNVAFTQANYSRATVNLRNAPTVTLAELGIETDHGAWIPGISFTTDFSKEEIALLRAAGYQINIQIEDVQAWYRDQNKPQVTDRNEFQCSEKPSDIEPYALPANYSPGSMGGYHTLDEMLQILDNMHTKFPNLITARAVISNTLLTHEGRPLWWVRISDNPTQEESNEPQVLYTALHHAREPNSLSQMLNYMWYLLENYESGDPQIMYLLNNAELYFVPCINPDGYVYNQTISPQGGGLWRKNRRVNDDGSFGVDLNRNYGYNWAYDDFGSSFTTNAETYRGPSAFSEPETRLIRDFCLNHDFQLTFNYHTHGNLLIYPWAYSNSVGDTASAILAPMLTRENNWRYGTTGTTLFYSVNGSSDDWMLADPGILAFTPEVGPRTTGFWPPAQNIEGLNRSTVWQNLGGGLSVLRLYVPKLDKAAGIYAENNDLPITVRRYGLAEGQVIVSLVPLTNNVTVAAPASIALDLNRWQEVALNFQYTLAPDISLGDSVVFLLDVDHGDYHLTDTIRKRYYGYPRIELFSETGDDTNGWEGEWGSTTERFVSPPASITDSPDNFYANNYSSSFTTLQPITIPAHAIKPDLRFQASWTIQTNSDWVNLYANLSNNVLPLCGRYSIQPNAGSPSSDPYWSGFQPEFVEEYIDMSDFAGQSFTLSFVINTNGSTVDDGFYFDDLKISYIDTTFVSSVNNPDNAFFRVTVQPNPISTEAIFSWNVLGNAKINALQLNITDAQGRVLYQQAQLPTSAQKWVVPAANWVSGTYFYEFYEGTRRITGGKIVK
jgi:carboxypeptidase T